MENLKITRRQMLIQSTGALAGFSLLNGCKQNSVSKWHPSYAATGKGFKIGSCDWSLGHRANPASLVQAKQFGLDGVQVDFGLTQNDTLPLLDPDLQKKHLDTARQQHVEIASLALGVLNNVPYKTEAIAETWVAKGIEVARAMNVKVILLAFFGKGDLREDPQGMDSVVQRLKKVTPQAENAGVILGIESWLNAEQHLEIIDRVNSPALQVYYDVGNSLLREYDIYAEIRHLGQRICEFHAKDYDNLFGQGSVNFPQVRQAMDDIGYRGWIQLEPVKYLKSREETFRLNTQYLRKIFPAEV
jgi:L-ribulose-5-phosphate 3-epimerase